MIQKKTETLNKMVKHVTWFIQVQYVSTGKTLLYLIKIYIQVGEAWEKLDMKQYLLSMFESTKTVRNQTRIRSLKTETGIKDNYLEFFLDCMSSSYVKIRNHIDKQEALSNFVQMLPSNVISPIWRIPGLDSHTDTPVKILYVILLGFVKYFWQDVTQNQLKNNLTR
jgi:hypothetical protein